VFITDQAISDRAPGDSDRAPVEPDCAPHVLEARTRDRVLQSISEDGPLTATALATRLGLTPAAVRRHLDLLVDKGDIEEHEPATSGGRGRGRPARAYVLSEAGHIGMDSDYDEIATSALRFLAEHAGEEAVGDFARERIAEFEARYATLLATSGEDVTARAQALATALTANGYAASTRPVGAGTPLAGVQLCQGHCPVQHVAAEFPQFCDAETDAFSRLLGVHVQRLATLAHGEHVCTTFIPLNAVPVKTIQSQQSQSGTPTSDGRSIT
jgi:predicted ArsR family transcriptional regulator